MSSDIPQAAPKKSKRSLFNSLFSKDASATPVASLLSPQTPPTSTKRRDDLVQAFDALALSGRSTPPSNTTPQGFVGGFNPGYTPPVGSYVPDPQPVFPNPYDAEYHNPPQPPKYPTPEGVHGPSSPDPGPPFMSMPQSYPPNINEYDPNTQPQQYSLTMQHALRPADAFLTPNPLPSRPHSTSILPPLSLPITAGPSPSGSPKPPRPAANRPRAASTPSSPTTSTSGGDATQCSGVTKAGKRCTRQVKSGPALSSVDTTVERFCFQHSKEVLGPSGFYAHKGGEWVKFEDWIPDYLHPDTQVALRVEMEKGRSQSDVPGYIYTFEIRDPAAPKIQLKVGRAVNLVKRIDQWGKQCTSKEQVLRGWYPGTVDEDENGTSLMKGRVKAGAKGACCHRLERLVHLELADLCVTEPYLEPGWPGAVKASKMAVSKKADKDKDKPCPDCGAVHKEIFEFTRVEKGKYKGKEWEGIVKPVIEKWGAFVEAFV